MGSGQTQESITLRVDQKEAQEVLVKEECSRQDPFIKASQATKMMSIFNAVRDRKKSIWKTAGEI